MGEAVNAEFIELNRGTPIERIRAALRLDIGDRPVITEGGKPLFQAVWMKKFGNCGPVIHLAADETIPNIFDRYEHYRRVDQIVHRIEHRYVDGVIGISEDICQGARDLGVDHVRKCYPFTDKYDSLNRLPIDTSGNRLVSVGHKSPKNNLEILPEVARRTSRDVHIDIVGNRTDSIQSENVTGHGFVEVEKFAELFDRAAGFIHPAVSQMFCVAVLEAMHAGLPPIITQNVGAQEIVRNIDSMLVTDHEPGRLAAAVDQYFDRKDRDDLATVCREVAEEYRPERAIKRFEQAYEDVIASV